MNAAELTPNTTLLRAIADNTLLDTLVTLFGEGTKIEPVGDLQYNVTDAYGTYQIFLVSRPDGGYDLYVEPIASATTSHHSGEIEEYALYRSALTYRDAIVMHFNNHAVVDTSDAKKKINSMKAWSRVSRILMGAAALIYAFTAVYAWRVGPSDIPLVRDAYFPDYSTTVTMGDALDRFLTGLEWHDMEIEGEDYVVATGGCTYLDEPATLVMVFSVDDETEVVSVADIGINDQSMPAILWPAMIQTIYDDSSIDYSISNNGPVSDPGINDQIPTEPYDPNNYIPSDPTGPNGEPPAGWEDEGNDTLSISEPIESPAEPGPAEDDFDSNDYILHDGDFYTEIGRYEMINHGYMGDISATESSVTLEICYDSKGLPYIIGEATIDGPLIGSDAPYVFFDFSGNMYFSEWDSLMFSNDVVELEISSDPNDGILYVTQTDDFGDIGHAFTGDYQFVGNMHPEN